MVTVRHASSLVTVPSPPSPRSSPLPPCLSFVGQDATGDLAHLSSAAPWGGLRVQGARCGGQQAEAGEDGSEGRRGEGVVAYTVPDSMRARVVLVPLRLFRVGSQRSNGTAADPHSVE